MASGMTPYSSPSVNGMPNNPEQKNMERRQQVYVGALPQTFLRTDHQPTFATPQQQQQYNTDEQAAWALQQQLLPPPAAYHQINATGRLSITIVQAKLTKNYGMTRMDPYARLRIGHNIYETHTDNNGAKNPHWNKVVQCYLPKGVNIIHLEIYDECAFTIDELVAWAHVPIPEAVLSGDTTDDWYPLTGKQGEEKEGMVNLVLTHTAQAVTQPPMTSTVMVMPSPYGGQVTTLPITYQAVQPQMMVPAIQPHQQPPPQLRPIPQITEEEIKLMQEMFPAADADTIKTVYEANQGNKDATVHSLLQITSEN